MNTQSIHIGQIVPPSPKLSQLQVQQYRPRISPSLEVQETDFSLQEPVFDGVDCIPAFIPEDQPATQIPGMDSQMLDEFSEDNFEGKRSYKRFVKGKSCCGIISQVLWYACENSRARKRINKSS